MLPRGDKFQDRARMVVMIGFCENKKGYDLYEYKTGIMFVSRDVILSRQYFLSRKDHIVILKTYSLSSHLGTPNEIVSKNKVVSKSVQFMLEQHKRLKHQFQ